jgi:hypothetical protein
MEKKIIADEAMLAKIRTAADPAEICDPSGNTVAVVVSPGFYRDVLLAWANTQFDPEQAELAWQDYLKNGGRSTAEVFEWLKTLDSAPRTGP